MDKAVNYHLLHNFHMLTVIRWGQQWCISKHILFQAEARPAILSAVSTWVFFQS